MCNKSSYSLPAFRLWQIYIKAEFVVAWRLRVSQELKPFRIIYLLFACWVDHLAHYLSSFAPSPTPPPHIPGRRKSSYVTPKKTLQVPLLLLVSVDLWLGVLTSCDWRSVTAAAARRFDSPGSGAAGS